METRPAAAGEGARHMPDISGDWMEPPPRPEASRRRGWTAALALAAVIAVIALVLTFAYMRRRAGEQTPDLLALAATRAGAASVAIGTDDPGRAHQFILDQFGWPLDVPELESASLVGVGVDPLVAGVELPFLRYRTEEGVVVTVYAFDYAFLDAASRQVQLAPAVYARLSTVPALDVRRQDERYVIVWRRRAAIYAAVTNDADAAGLLTDEVRSDTPDRQVQS
jgi:hypothetical protein